MDFFLIKKSEAVLRTSESVYFNDEVNYSIPAFMNERIADGVRVKVIETPARWMGLVSHDDKIQVLLRINDMIRKGIYPSKLF